MEPERSFKRSKKKYMDFSVFDAKFLSIVGFSKLLSKKCLHMEYGSGLEPDQLSLDMDPVSAQFLYPDQDSLNQGPRPQPF